MAISPDTKNWTWVLERACPDCGFDSSSFPRGQVSQLLRDNAMQWQDILTGDSVTARPSPEVWSPLEYACHVRDVFRIFAERLNLMVTTDNPQFANWDQDQTAVEDRYSEQDPAAVSADLTANAETLASAFEAVSGDQWRRTGDRSDGSHFTVESFARYLVHDPVHHVFDVTGVKSW